MFNNYNIKMYVPGDNYYIFQQFDFCHIVQVCSLWIFQLAEKSHISIGKITIYANLS